MQNLATYPKKCLLVANIYAKNLHPIIKSMLDTYMLALIREKFNSQPHLNDRFEDLEAFDLEVSFKSYVTTSSQRPQTCNLHRLLGLN